MSIHAYEEAVRQTRPHPEASMHIMHDLVFMVHSSKVMTNCDSSST
jgi:hypothetical protein